MTQKKILIVEDNAETRYMLEQLLASGDHQITAAQNGEEALRVARQVIPDVIISDIMMPVMNGFRLCREVKKDPVLRLIPFVLYTATFVDDSDERLAMSLGASRFVVKPAEGEAFLQILDDVLKEHELGILPVPEEPLEGEDTLLEMYDSSMTRKLAETVEKLQDERKALTKSEQRLKQALELTHVGHWELDLKTNALEWSDDIYRILGLKPRDIDPSYETFIASVHPDDRIHVARAHKESLSKKTPNDIEYRLLLEDGTVKYAHERFQTLYDDRAMPACSTGTVQDITERKRTEEALQKSERKVRRKLDGILSPETDIEALELSDIIDSEKVQKLMDEFYRLTNVGIGIIDLHGKVLVGTGWQDICTQFHRIHPESCRLCIESDLELSRNVRAGAFKQYRCKNNMWDIATPIMLGDKHVGNIFLGQFLFDDETPDYEAFRQQARRYGFNEEEYLAALDRVPRWSHQKVDAAMSFYTALAGMVGNLSYSNIKLANALEQGRKAEETLRESEKRFRDLYENAPNAYFSIGVDGLIRRCNRRAGELLGYAVKELAGRPVMELYADTRQGKAKARRVLQRFLAGEIVRDEELEMQRADGNPVWISLTVDAVRDAQGRIVESRSMVVDITERKQVESIMQARLHLLELANSCSIDEFLTAALDEIEALTGSTIGFYHFLEADQKTLSLQSWSTNTLKNMCNAEGKGSHYDVAQAGVWVDCIHQRGPVIHNDYTSLPHRKGMPEGHAPVIREVVVPIFRGNMIKAIIGVGNKSGDYEGSDVEIVSQLGDLSWDIVERKQAEKALKQAERKYRNIFENAVEGIFQTTPEGRYLSVNPALAKMHGYDSPQDLIASVIDIESQLYVNPGDRAGFQESLEQHGFVNEFVTELYRKDGSIIWVSFNARGVRGSDGGIRYYEGTIEDITVRKRAEEALRESEERYRTIFQNSPVGIFRTTIEGRFLEANPAAAKLFGYDSPETLIREIHDIGKQLFAHPEDRPRIISEQIGSSGVTRRVNRYRRKDGSELIANLYLQTIRSAEGQPLFFEGIVEDITERVRAEEALRMANETLRATLEAAPVAIFDLDTEGRVKSLWNAAAEQMLGWGRDELIGHFLPSVQEGKKEEFARFRELMRSGKRMMGHDVVRRRKDGSLIEYSIYAAPEYDKDGKVIGNIAVLVDITERKQAENEIRKLNMELEQRVKDRTTDLEAANKELEAFAYSVSHDLRAPLRHIDGFLELLQNRMTTTRDQKSAHYMAVISDSAKKMGKLIDDLLSFSRMGRSEMTKKQIDLGGLVQEVIREIAPDAEGRNIHWQIGDLPVVTGDHAMLRIVVVNLISNALKFTRPNKQAEIEIGYTGDKETEPVIFVRDNGVGFDMGYADKLFSVFQRLHHADEFEGTGIGLAMVHRIISRHGGRTWAEGKVGQGATFYFSLSQSAPVA